MFFSSKSQKYAPVSVNETIDSADESDHLYKPEENADETPSFLQRCLNFLCSGVIIVLILLLVIIWSLKYDVTKIFIQTKIDSTHVLHFLETQCVFAKTQLLAQN